MGRRHTRAQGAALALEDALVLADLLVTFPDYARATVHAKCEQPAEETARHNGRSITASARPLVMPAGWAQSGRAPRPPDRVATTRTTKRRPPRVATGVVGG